MTRTGTTLILSVLVCLMAVAADAQSAKQTAKQTAKWWRITSIQQELGLTRAQVRSIEAIFHANHRRRLTLNETLTTVEADLARAFARADEAMAIGLIGRVETARSERNKARIMMLMRMYRVLTLQQRRGLAALQARTASRKNSIPAPKR